jgi:hypothetical protein
MSSGISEIMSGVSPAEAIDDLPTLPESQLRCSRIGILRREKSEPGPVWDSEDISSAPGQGEWQRL